MTTVTRQIVESHPYPRDFEANLRRAGVTIEETGETALRARVAQLEAWLNERYSGIEAELNKCEALRARVAELEADKKKQSEMFFKALKERPVAPHPVDQMANIYREMLLDAEVECKSLRTALMAVWESIMDEDVPEAIAIMRHALAQENGK